MTQNGAEVSLGGEVSLLIGKKKEHTSSPLSLISSTQGRLQGTAMVGAQASAKAGGGLSYNPTDGVSGSLKGEGSAFVGGSFSVTPTLEVVDQNDAKLFSGSATVGVSAGAGLEYSGEGSFEGGRIVFKSKGKLAVGLGMEWGVSVDINAPSVYKALMG
jgi:hypothetical protein